MRTARADRVRASPALRSLHNLDRRSFLQVSAAATAAAMIHGVASPHSFQPITFRGGRSREGFRIAYISDRFVKSLLRAVDDVNRMDPQPDFVPFGGDLAQLGAAAELDPRIRRPTRNTRRRSARRCCCAT